MDRLTQDPTLREEEVAEHDRRFDAYADELGATYPLLAPAMATQVGDEEDAFDVQILAGLVNVCPTHRAGRPPGLSGDRGPGGRARRSAAGRRTGSGARPDPALVRALVELLQAAERLVGVGAGVRVPRLDAQLRVEVLPDHLHDRLLRAAHRALRVAQDLARDSLRLLEQLIVRHHLRHEVPRERLLRVDRLGREQHLRRDGGAACVDETDDPAVAVVVAAAGLERPEHRALGGDPDVARQRLLEPARERPAVDGPDDGLVDLVQPAGERAEAQVDDLPHAALAADDRRDVGLEVGARAARVAGAGEDRDVDRVVVAELGPDLDEQLLHLGVDAVLDLGPVEGDEHDAVALVDQDLGHQGVSSGWKRQAAAMNGHSSSTTTSASGGSGRRSTSASTCRSPPNTAAPASSGSIPAGISPARWPRRRFSAAASM